MKSEKEILERIEHIKTLSNGYGINERRIKELEWVLKASKLHQPTVSICACGSNEYYVEQYKDVTKYYCKSCHEKISKH